MSANWFVETISLLSEVIAPSSSFHGAGFPSRSRQCERTLPSNNTIASLGGVAPTLKVPGVTIGGCGRSGSCTCHLPSGCIGVSLKPDTPLIFVSTGPAARQAKAVRRTAGMITFIFILKLFLLGKCRVERGLIGRKIQFAHELTALGRAVHAVHAAVFPFNREWPTVADVVQRHDDVFEFD